MNPVINKIGDKCWYNEQGRLHRTDGPAIEYANGDKLWYINGTLHRENGPAVEWGYNIVRWYYRGNRVNCNSQEEFEGFLRFPLFF